MKKDETILVLNSLITINNDRIEGYETASKATEELDLKSLFERFITTSKRCKQELVWEVTALGGEEAEGTKISGKFFRVWMNVKAALTGRDRKAILDSCEYGEERAKNTYDNVLENNLKYLSIEQQTMIKAQRALLKVDHELVKTLRNALVEA